MVKIVEVTTNKQRKEFINFYYDVYKGDQNFKDNLSLAAKNFLYSKDTFSKSCIKIPILVYNDKIEARCIYIIHPDFPYVQIAFFEALPNAETAVAAIVEYGRALAKEHNIELLAGINGHTTYGVGFLVDNNFSPSFDAIYSMPYYCEYFEPYAKKVYKLADYNMLVDNYNIDNKSLKRIYKNYTFREIDLKNFKAEIEILGRLFNETLKDTPFYFNKTVQESYELLKPLLPLIKNSNIIYVMKDEIEVGFIIWHADYNQVLENKRYSILGFMLRYLLHRSKMGTIKINAIGVLPEHKNKGAALMLCNELFKALPKQYKQAESGFVSLDNTPSTRLTLVFDMQIKNEYKLFELKV